MMLRLGVDEPVHAKEKQLLPTRPKRLKPSTEQIRVRGLTPADINLNEPGPEQYANASCRALAEALEKYQFARTKVLQRQAYICRRTVERCEDSISGRDMRKAVGSAAEQAATLDRAEARKKRSARRALVSAVTAGGDGEGGAGAGGDGEAGPNAMLGGGSSQNANSATEEELEAADIRERAEAVSRWLEVYSARTYPQMRDAVIKHDALTAEHHELMNAKQAVLALLRSGGSINTALSRVATRGTLLELAVFLIQHGETDLDERDDDGLSPFMHAALHGQCEMIAAFVAHDASVNLRSDKGETALHCGTVHGGPQVVKVLCVHGADPNQGDFDGVSPLACAARHGLIEEAKVLLHHGAVVENVTATGQTALFFAVDRGEVAMAELLLSKARSSSDYCNVADKEGHTALHIAASQGQRKAAQLLINTGAKVNTGANGGETPLMLAAQQGHLSMAEYLVERRSRIDQPNGKGATALMIAAHRGHTDMVALLLRLGSSIACRDKEERTVLHYAASAGRVAVLRCLVSQSALSDPADKDAASSSAGPPVLTSQPSTTTASSSSSSSSPNAAGASAASGPPLSAGAAAAAATAAAKAAALLRSFDVDAQDATGKTPLMLAAARGDVKSARVLVAHGAMTSVRNHLGKDALQHAADGGDYETVKFLSAHGGDANRENVAGRSAIEIAMEQGHLPAVRAMGGLEVTSSAFGVNPQRYVKASSSLRGPAQLRNHTARMCEKLGIQLHQVTEPVTDRPTPQFSWT